MTSELKPCPFCGKPPVLQRWKGATEQYEEYRCGRATCVNQSPSVSAGRWNHRPAEAALQDKLDAAVRLLEQSLHAIDRPLRYTHNSVIERRIKRFLDSLTAPSPPAGECGTCGGTGFTSGTVIPRQHSAVMAEIRRELEADRHRAAKPCPDCARNGAGGEVGS